MEKKMFSKNPFLTSFCIIFLFLCQFIVAEKTDKPCTPFKGRIQAKVIDERCPEDSPGCTAGWIKGNTLRGRTFFVVRDIGAGAGLFKEDPATVFSYTGGLVIATKHGRLKVKELGIVDFKRGRFSEMGRIIGGTNRFEGARGRLNIFGSVKYDDLKNPVGFVGDVVGKICRVRGNDGENSE
jgi:hypothetical protein